ncbi:MAG: hypothetical protein HY429_02865 [Candidatus Levybacteria bacterium]|nr:hypothetical protein [Candidatus Levybacteria bacterium]
MQIAIVTFNLFLVYLIIIYGIGVFLAPATFLFFIKERRNRSKILYRIIVLLLVILIYLTITGFWQWLANPPKFHPL